MNPRAIESWEKTRKGGMARFLLVYGLLLWGVPMFLLEMFWLQPGPRSPISIGASAIMWALASLLYGYLLWRALDSRYFKALTRRRT
jgi:hypothetical protein